MATFYEKLMNGRVGLSREAAEGAVWGGLSVKRGGVCNGEKLADVAGSAQEKEDERRRWHGEDDCRAEGALVLGARGEQAATLSSHQG
jgi:hypothetical protein